MTGDRDDYRRKLLALHRRLDDRRHHRRLSDRNLLFMRMIEQQLRDDDDKPLDEIEDVIVDNWFFFSTQGDNS